MSWPASPVSSLSGYAPALPTPFRDDGTLDGEAVARSCDRQIQHGATALVVCGTTGEAATLRPQEQAEVIRAAVASARGRVPVIAGAVANATASAIALAQGAADAGADAILCVVPYYNRPSQGGMLAHFRAIAGAASLPIILYDVPARTAASLADETLLRLAEIPGIVGLKDATGDVTRPLRLRAALGPDFRLLSGDDASAAGYIAQGGDGCISVTSNVAPGLCRRMHAALAQGRMAEARRLGTAVGVLTSALAVEPSPVPVKFALSLMNIMSAGVRLPLVELTGDSQAGVATALQRFCEHYRDDMVGEIAVAKPRRTDVAGREAAAS